MGLGSLLKKGNDPAPAKVAEPKPVEPVKLKPRRVIGLTQGVLAGSVIPLLRSTEKVEPMKPDDLVRASGLGKMCPREEVLCSKLGLARTVVRTEDNEWWFGMGTAIHHLFQSVLLGPRGLLLGHWRCVSCGAEFGGQGNRVAWYGHCCEDAEPILIEDYVVDTELGIHGHPDGEIVFPGLPRAVIDFKSANDRSFQRLSLEPDEAHVDQLMFYMHAMKMKVGVLLYINKHAQRFSQVLAEHWFEFDQEVFENGIVQKIKALREGLRRGVLPGRTCVSGDDWRAAECSCRAACFQADGT